MQRTAEYAGIDGILMGVKIKSTDDRIPAAAIAVLLITRDRMAQAQAGGLIADALNDFRSDYAGY
ncbi:MAG: hypothetical protein J6386_01735 [Candidatus Synoicihabitans palmerolidicus]|nr:hypothetical protein [Candidatus Synoicihabitans palmerolidicus]